MSYIYKVTAAWTGFNGAPGYSNFFWQAPGEFEGEPPINVADACNEVSFFLEGIKSLLPNAVRVTISSDVPALHADTGKMATVTTGGTFGPTIGTGGAGSYSGASGACVTYRTAGVRNGRRVRGRTFLVPLAAGAYDTDGTLNGSAITTLKTAADGFLTITGSHKLGVWARPTAPGASDGAWHEILSTSVADKVAILRSRRD